MKITKIQTAYPGYVKKFYDKRPGLAEKPYADQKAALDYDAFGWADFWGNAFRSLGHDIREYVANVEPLAKSWAAENGVKYSAENWMLDIAKAQVLAHKPDILFMVDYELFPREWVEDVHRSCPSIRLVVGYCGAPFRDPEVFKSYGIVLSDTPELVEQFVKMGHKAFLILHGFDKRILDRIDLKAPERDDFSFVGSIVRGNQFHMEREQILEKIARRIPIAIYAPHADVTPKDYVRFGAQRGAYEALSAMKKAGVSEEMLARVPKLSRLARRKDPPVFPVNLKLKRLMKPAVYGLDMFQMLRCSKATFNCHINVSPRTANNLRLYEATGVGTCLVTDWKENLASLFELEKEVVTYRSAEECIEKVQWLLANPKARHEIAQAGQARTLRDYSWVQSARNVLGLIERHL